MNVLIFIATAIGGGLLVYLFETLSKRGNVKVDNYNLLATYYHTDNFQNYINKFNLDIQFINTSGYTKIINQFSAKYFDSQKNIDLSFNGFNVPPAGVIESRHVKCLQFELYPLEKASFPIDNTIYFEVNYKLDGKPQVIVIKRDEINFEDKTPVPFYMG